MSDAEILEAMRDEATQERAFRALMTRYQERLYLHIRRMVTTHSDADDVLQNTLIKVYRGIANFKGQSELYTWLYRIATNESLTFLKQRKRRTSSSIQDEDLGIENQLQADTWFDGDAAQRQLKAAIATLPHKQQLVFNMRYYDDMTYKDISEVVGTSVGALKASYHHAAKKIEAFLRNG